MPEEQKKESTEKTDPKRYAIDAEAAPVVTQHQIEIGGKPFEYSVTTGMMPLKDEFGELEAGIFFMAYTKAGANRPLMFSFNGGPGSSSVWLHLGALGPKRIPMANDGELPNPPYKVVDNPNTWLEHTDLVFIDPVGTGYSRPAKENGGDKYWSLNGDLESVAEFIRLYLSRYQRWSSPLYLVGESYGTTRASGLSDMLLEQGIALNGIVLVSSILNFLTARWMKGNDLPNILFLPTYTATAWYHKKLPADLMKDREATLREVEEFALGEYSAALAQGSALPAAQRNKIVKKLARYTGLRPEFIDNSDLRIEIHPFCKELLRDRKRTVGRLDSRIIGIDAKAGAEVPEHDPSIAAIRPPYTAAFNDYVRRDLGYSTDLSYTILGSLYQKWKWGEGGSMPDTSEALRAALSKNPYMRVYVASGFYDLATPYFATEYTKNHLGLDASLKDNIRTGYYEAGHMMYTHEGSLAQLKQEVSTFIKDSLGE
jgi:carboxypeptidase C (cathepsin A)